MPTLAYCHITPTAEPRGSESTGGMNKFAHIATTTTLPTPKIANPMGWGEHELNPLGVCRDGRGLGGVQPFILFADVAIVGKLFVPFTLAHQQNRIFSEGEKRQKLKKVVWPFVGKVA